MTNWDIIVVGGGVAGTVISSRLHQKDPTLKILLIEGGPDTRNIEGIESLTMAEGMVGKYSWAVSTPS